MKTSHEIAGETVHLHQVIHVEQAAPERIPWFPSDYLVTDLDIDSPDGDAVRMVSLPLDHDSPQAVVSVDYIAELFHESKAQIATHGGIPVWGY